MTILSYPQSPEEIIKSLMSGAVPERSDEIEELWAQYHPKIVVAGDKPGITLNATKERIEFDLKTIDVFWVVGFSGWRAIECYGPHVFLSKCYDKPLEDMLVADDELPEIERSYKERLTAARRLTVERGVEGAPWPDDLPRPSSNRDALADPQYEAAFDLTVTATAFTFFHEYRHVMLDFDGQRPNNRKEEELLADVWARQFMTVKLGEYAKSHSKDYREVLRKRSMGLALAALIIHEITPQYGGNCDYFPIKIRLTSLLHNTSLPEDDSFWCFAASLLVGMFRQQHIPINMPPMPARALAERLLALLPD